MAAALPQLSAHAGQSHAEAARHTSAAVARQGVTFTTEPQSVYVNVTRLPTASLPVAGVDGNRTCGDSAFLDRQRVVSSPLAHG